MDIFAVFSLLGGLGLFLYGMEIMGDGLKNSSADTLRRILTMVTSNPLKGFLLGFFITGLIQSSTATIVLTAGLIGAGIMTLKQSIGIVLGANVGTTVTAQIIRLMDVEGSSGSKLLQVFEPSTLSPIAIVIGIICIVFIKKQSVKNVGLIAMGFGILFVGLMNMTSSMSPLASSQKFIDIVVKFSGNPIYGIIIGMIVTMIVQSSSASVGILQTLCSTGVMTFSCSYGYVVGAAIGTGIIAGLLCFIGTKEDAKRLGIIHILVSILGAILCLIVMESLHAFGFIDGLWGKYMSSGDIADFQMLFKLVTALVLLPFTPLFERISYKVIKDPKPIADNDDEKRIKETLSMLDEHLFMTPTLALANVDNVVSYMSELAYANFNAAIQQFDEYSEERTAKIQYREELLDSLADAVNFYLVSLSSHVVNPGENNRLSYYMEVFPLYEHIGDMAQNINEDVISMNEKGYSFSGDAKNELHVLIKAVDEVLSLAVKCSLTFDESCAKLVEPLEEVIDDFGEMLKHNHIERLKLGTCDAKLGIYFLDMITNFERMSDQASDLAVYTLAFFDPSIQGREHHYLHELHHFGNDEYKSLFSQYEKKYDDMLKACN